MKLIRLLRNMESMCDANVCRICYEMKEDTRSLFLNRNDYSLYDKLVKDAKLNLDINDGGPSSICAQCFEEFHIFMNFLNKCMRANEIFLQFKQNMKDSDSNANLSLHEHADEINAKTDSNKNEIKQQNLEQSDCQKSKGTLSTSAYTCQFCGKIFTRKFNFKVHLQKHSGAGVPSLERTHEQREPRARRVCPAPACTRSFTSLTNLRTHLRKHTGERPYVCKECGKTFRCKNTLNDHTRIHTGVKPYLCPACGKRFATNKLARHMRTHGADAADAGEHACGTCSRRFGTARALLQHARTHGPGARQHACAACPARYSHRQSLNKHVRARHPKTP